MLVPVNNAGAAGVVRDLSVTELPVNAWSDALNIRFLDGMAYQSYGHESIYPPAVTPLHLLPVTVAGDKAWLYAGAAKLYIVSSAGVHANITRQTASVDVNYTATPNAWTSCVLGGVPILNNGVDAPQQWLLTGKATALSAWPAATTCAVMRAFKNSLIALDVTKGAVRYPYMVKWSHPADPGTVPATWDPADATKDAGEFDLSDGYGYIIDGLALRDSFMIYKTDGVFRLDYTGGAFIYRNQKVLGMSGALARNCVAEIDGMHFVLTASDIVIHDGQQASSILDKKARRSFFSDMDSANAGLSFVFRNPFFNEVWVCYPQAGSSVCDKALIYNWVDKTVTYRTLPNLHHAACGPLGYAPAAATWDADTTPWGADLGVWNGSDTLPGSVKVLLASSQSKLFLLDSIATFDSVKAVSYLERTGLHFDAPEKIKTIRGIRPRIQGSTGDTVMVSVGSSAEPYGEPTYSPAVPFVIGQTVSCDAFASGRYLAVKFSSGTAYSWRLDGFAMDVATRGGW